MLGELNTFPQPSLWPGQCTEPASTDWLEGKLPGQLWQCPLLSLTSKAGAWPAHRPPALLGLSILLLPGPLNLPPPTSPPHAQPHFLGHPWGPAVSQGSGLGALSDPRPSSPTAFTFLGVHPAMPSRAALGSFHLLPSLVHWEANMAIFIPAKCSCSGRQTRDALPGWERGEAG